MFTCSETKNFNTNGYYPISNHLIIQVSFTYKDDYVTKDYKSKEYAVNIALDSTNNSQDKKFYLESFFGFSACKLKNTSIKEMNSYANFR
ncbi:hypothetical protein [Polaribacter glomeratus]|uniref:Uncharacterized protein n=1 Tax=Polaribacter glomeratus TaxID=102 RepID=A0A2S7WGE7_9FLAO|nr:hypothetical protein [Polaribacter glomeratus]PQJ76688.1 hypothetical protein BTO16_12445 [Polaribacter glomeratus]TXD67471.1 hypothetical protein ESX12_02470 [Polaribacter glomeratus]